ncbi:hypothetical protein PG985_013639 [Apiospora marii]|uniref:uncharacterized protein n=1 Tax=Apiospora marii TaxID=335849 RepID=UPI0031301523
MRTAAPIWQEEERPGVVQVAPASRLAPGGGYRKQGAPERRQRVFPICLASLYGLPPNEAEASECDPEGDLESGTLKKKPTVKETSASDDVAEMAEAAKTKVMSKLQRPKRSSWRPQPIDDEILKMRRCPHMFHARCLATWFLMKRYDCPVCRAAYYQNSNESEESLSGRETVQPATLGIPVLPFW